MIRAPVHRRRFLLLALAVAACALRPGTDARAQEPLVIGVGGPLTGQFELFGTSLRAGVEAAAGQANAAGGVDGRQLSVAVADDACDAGKAPAAANQLVGAGAVFVVGHICYSPTREAGAIYAAHAIVQIAPSTETDALTDRRPGPGLFRLAPRASRQGYVAGTFMANRFPEAAIAILHDGTAYGKDLADRVKATLNAEGIQEVWFDQYPSGQKDYARIAGRLKDNAVNVVYLGGYHEDIAQIAVAIRDAGLETVIVGPDSLADSEYAALAGPAATGTFYTYLKPLPETPRAKLLGQIVDREAAIDPRTFMLGYAAVERWISAVNTAGSTDFDAVTGAMNDGAAETVIGPVRFDGQGDWVTDGFAVFEWTADGAKPVKTPGTD